MMTPEQRASSLTPEEQALPSPSYIVVLPHLRMETSARCVETMLAEGSSAGFTRDRVVVVDNSREGSGRTLGLRAYRNGGHNIGVAASWNHGIYEMRRDDLDYVVLCSASMVFGADMHGTFYLNMRRHAGMVVEALGHSWHLIAFPRAVIEAVGCFDPNFYPAYMEDVDYGHRMQLAGLSAHHKSWAGWEKVWINAISTNGLHSHDVTVNGQALRDYYVRKWGGLNPHETKATPFDSGDLSYYPDRGTVPEIAKRYGLDRGVWW